VTVRDNGPGMDEATRSRMFEPFFTTKPVGEGTGLGLAVVHGIVQAHEANIVVHSEPGKGTSFRIYFPAVDAAVPALAEQEPLVVPKGNGDALVLHGEGKHILYVDDDDAIVFLMRRLLERRGFRVSGYTDAYAAVAAVRADPGQFDLAVTDHNMPAACRDWTWRGRCARSAAICRWLWLRATSPGSCASRRPRPECANWSSSPIP
jgi:hypothetical protein